MEWIDEVRRHIDKIVTAPGSRNAMAERARIFNPTMSDTELTPMLDQLELFVRGTPDLIQAAALDAEQHGVLMQVQPMLNTAAQYFFIDYDVIPDHLGLYGLLDDAYLAQKYLLSASELHERVGGAPLLGETLRPSIEVVRQWIGPAQADTLDQMVAQDVRNLKWKGALVAGALGLVAWQVLSSFGGGTDDGAGSWGNSWESETSRMAAGLGISTPW